MKNGKVVLMQTGADVAGVLANMLKCPLGAVAGLMEDGPWAALQSSMVKMKEPVFQQAKQDVLVNTMHISEELEAKRTQKPVEDPQVGNMSITRTSPSAWTLTATAAGWTNGAAFTAWSHDSFEVSLVLGSHLNNVMLGIAPMDQVAPRLTTNNLFTQLGFYAQLSTNTMLYGQDGTGGAKALGLSASAGETVTMKFSGKPSPSLCYSVRGGPWQTASFNQAIPCGHRYCPVVLLCHQNVKVDLHINAGIGTKAVPPFTLWQSS